MKNSLHILDTSRTSTKQVLKDLNDQRTISKEDRQKSISENAKCCGKKLLLTLEIIFDAQHLKRNPTVKLQSISLVMLIGRAKSVLR